MTYSNLHIMEYIEQIYILHDYILYSNIYLDYNCGVHKIWITTVVYTEASTFSHHTISLP